MGVTIKAGQAYISATPSSQDAQILRARASSDYTAYTINANSTGSTKYDWIYLKVDATKANNPAADASDVTSIYTSRSSSNTTDNGTPPTYGLLLAVITVANGASSITNGNITDKRSQAIISGVGTSSVTSWNSLSAVLTYSANNGNKEFILGTSVDVSNTLSVGMKLNVTRATTPPTQCMSFTAASSQYATKASPTGITFTSAFTCEAWVYLNSYPTSTGGMIISRLDSGAVNGWYFSVDTAGRLVGGFGSAGLSTATSYQSLPLKRWVHVALTATVASKTFSIYLNGNSIPYSTSGTVTTLTQPSQALMLGTYGSPSGQYFDGYISEARVWSVVQSQANIQANMAISLTGSETNLVALFQGNGNFNDKTSNGNNLTATNGAIATQAANPYNAVEYGIITQVTSSQLTVFAGTDCNIPNMTLTSPQYSTARAPYGFPVGREKWLVDALNYADSTFGVGSSTSTYYSFPAFTLTVPTGEWRLVEDIKNFQWNGTTSATILGRSVVSTESVATGAAFTDTSKWVMGTSTRHGGNGASAEFDATITSSVDITVTSPTTYYMGFRTEAASGNYGQRHLGQTNTAGVSRFYAESAYI